MTDPIVVFPEQTAASQRAAVVGLNLQHSVAEVGIVSTAVLAAKRQRKYALIVNDSDVVVYLNLNGDAALNAGIRLNASGGSYEISEALGNLFTGAINAIASAGGKKLLVTEGV